MSADPVLSMKLLHIYVLILSLITLGIVYAKRTMVASVYGWGGSGIYSFIGGALLIHVACLIYDLVTTPVGWIVFLSRAVFLLILPLLGYLWFFANCYALHIHWFRHRRYRLLVALPIFLTVVLLAASYRTGWVMGFDEGGNFVRGPYYWISYALYAVYSVVPSVICLTRGILQKDIVARRFLLSRALIPVPSVLTAILQYATGFVFFSIGVLASFVIYELDKQRRIMNRSILSERTRCAIFNMVSHDIRTPLNAMIGISDLLCRGVCSKEEASRLHGAILSSSHMLLHLVNDVLDETKMTQGRLEIHPERTNVAKLVTQVVDILQPIAREKGLSLRADTVGVPHLVVDGHRLVQIVFNVVGNALKNTTAGSVVVRSRYERGQLDVTVVDTGVGIAKGDLARLASPFVQVGSFKSRYSGSGLGLVICKRLLVLMNGQLVITSEVGKGTSVRFFIPCEESVLAAPASVTPTGGETTSDGLPRVLIVDDESLNRIALGRMLQSLGYRQVTVASDGLEALAKLRECPDGFDLVLTDLQMPNMNGEQLLCAIRSDPRLKALRVYVITADVAIRERVQTEAFDGVLIKPVTKIQLSDLLRLAHKR